jgi:hypothetical protein
MTRRQTTHRKARRSSHNAGRRADVRAAAIAANIARANPTRRDGDDRPGPATAADTDADDDMGIDVGVLDPAIPTHADLRGCEQDPGLAQMAFFRMLNRAGLTGLSAKQRDDALRDLTTICGPPVDDAAKLACAEAYAAVMRADQVACVGCAVCGEAVLGTDGAVHRVPLTSAYLQQLAHSPGRQSMLASVEPAYRIAYTITWPAAVSPSAQPLALNSAYVAGLRDDKCYTDASVADVCDGCNTTLMRLVLKPDCDAADGVDSINDDVRAHIARYDVDDERWGSDVPADPAEAEEHKRWLLVHRLRLLSVPRFSSLRMDLGVLPPWLPVLTVPEQMLLGLTRMNMILKLNAVGRQQQSRGHAILFGHEGLDPLTLSVVQEQLQSIGNDDTIPALRLVPGSVGVCLVGAREDCHRLCGGNTPAGNRRLAAACGTLLQVRPKALFAWARFLKAVHPAFRDLLVREETPEVCAALEAIPEQLVRDAHFAVSDEAVNTERMYGIGFGIPPKDVAGVRTTVDVDDRGAKSAPRAAGSAGTPAGPDNGCGGAAVRPSASDDDADAGSAGTPAGPDNGCGGAAVRPSASDDDADHATVNGSNDTDDVLHIVLLDPVLVCGDKGTVAAPPAGTPDETLQALLAALEADTATRDDPASAPGTATRPTGTPAAFASPLPVPGTAATGDDRAHRDAVDDPAPDPSCATPRPAAAPPRTAARAVAPGPIHIHRDKEPGNEFLLNSHLVTTAFATLFPLGTILTPYATMTTELTRHLLMQADKRCGRDIRFIFLAFNQLIRHRVCLHVALRASASPENFMQLHDVRSPMHARSLHV